MELKIKTIKVNGGLTPSMESIISEKLDFLSKYVKENEKTSVKISQIEHDWIEIKIDTKLINKKEVRITIKDKDFYTALDKIKDELKREVRKEREKNQNKFSKLKKHDACDIPEPLELIPTITKRKQFNIDAITEAMAINEMEKLKHEYFIFKNIEDNSKVSLLYRRTDGDYGIIIIEN